MPVLESTDGRTPRSALRYRSLDEANKHTIVTTAAHPVIQRASRTRPRPADDDLISEWKRGDTEESERVTNPPRRTSQPARHARSGVHPLLLLSFGMVAMLAFWLLLNAGIGWWNNTMDFIHYGNPRTFQIDAVVGHNDSPHNPSHFIALNLHGHIEIIEFPGGDGAHTHVYSGPQLLGSDADSVPVTLAFADVTGNHKPDMLVFFQSSWIVLINDQGVFRPPTANEQQEAVRYLAIHGQP